MRITLLAIWFLQVLGGTLPADEPQDREPLVLEKMGVFFVGGREVAMPSGGGRGGGGRRGGERGDGEQRGNAEAPRAQTQIAGQAMVHYFIPPKDVIGDKLPVVMVPGMGLTSALYLSTPDGREGWATTFARAGHPVYVLDGPQNGVTGFEVAPFANVKSGAAPPEKLPRMMLWANEITWSRWGIGQSVGVGLPDGRFPVAHIDQMHASMTPVITTLVISGGESTEATAIQQLLEKIEPSILMVHSMSGASGFAAIRHKPDLVKAIVAIEVVGSPTQSDDILWHFADKQLIGVYGDNFAMRRMEGRYQGTVAMADEITAAGGKAEVIRLPDLGIRGNSHLLMQDDNNLEIANMILERLLPTNEEKSPDGD